MVGAVSDGVEKEGAVWGHKARLRGSVVQGFPLVVMQHKEIQTWHVFLHLTVGLQMNQQCKVCNEPAAGFHFGAFTCEGCKVSFTAEK